MVQGGNEIASAPDSAPLPSTRALRLGPWVAFVAALLVHRDNLTRALLGWDTYATLVAARIQSGSDLAGTLTEKLMDGRLAFGDFYRPVGNLFVAFDLAVWGLDPFGHQLTSTVLFATACALVFVVVAQRQRTAEPAPAAWAATLVVLHPAALSILPVVARRTETLMIVFALLALAAAGTRAASSGRRSLLAGVCALLAVGSKEPGIVVLPLLAIDRLLAGEAAGDGRLRARVWGALRFVWPATVAVVLFGVLRTLVLGGLGGYFETPETSYALRLLQHGPRYLALVEVTGAPALTSAAPALAVIVTAALVAGVVLLWRVRSEALDARLAEWALPVLGAVWVGFQLALASTAEKPEPRYVEGLVVGLALVLAGFVDRARALAVAADGAGRPSSVAARGLLAAAAIVSFSALAGAPLWRDQPALALASRTQQQELAALEAKLRGRAPGDHRDRVRVRKVYGSPDPSVDHAWMLSPWGLQAWLELAFPERHFVVETDRFARPDPRYWNLIVLEHAQPVEG